MRIVEWRNQFEGTEESEEQGLRQLVDVMVTLVEEHVSSKFVVAARHVYNDAQTTKGPERLSKEAMAMFGSFVCVEHFLKTRCIYILSLAAHLCNTWPEATFQELLSSRFTKSRELGARFLDMLAVVDTEPAKEPCAKRVGMWQHFFLGWDMTKGLVVEKTNTEWDMIARGLRSQLKSRTASDRAIDMCAFRSA